ncbi:histone-lysine N-methyltransferase ash1-like [Sitophilus oryzae]|uniref:Histone-lysine N-methyltransferase ash1-like n=1 Tax=Sitophilus oryzae TaxID=7048 RepID=A0A6J2XZS4_SITOR|nr:histone-lysine N-methyltransferase ash1-like [Sitophilus oryzae]
MNKYKFNAFYVDLGSAYDMPHYYQCEKPLVNPDQYKSMFVNSIQNSISIFGVSDAIERPRSPSFVALPRFESSWDGLRRVIPTILTYGIIGYPFLIPGAVGGDYASIDTVIGQVNGSIHGLPDQELYIRWLQLSAFLPVVRFNRLPNSYGDKKVLDSAISLALLRQNRVNKAVIISATYFKQKSVCVHQGPLDMRMAGKTQRIRQLPETNVVKNPGRVGRPRKTEAKKKPSTTKDQVPINPQPTQQIIPQIQVRKVRDRSQSLSSSTVSRQQTATPTDTSAFMNQLNALQKPRNMKTRRIAQAEDDPELNKNIKLAAILKDILKVITTAKDDKDNLLSTNLMQLPSKRKVAEFYQRVSDPIDLSTIEQNIATGVYRTAQAFDEDMNKLFTGFSKFYDRTTDTGIATTKLKKIYVETKQQSLAKFEDVLGEKPPPAFVNNKKKNEEEDIIRCICGIPRDEGLMIQCERCMVWQHIECVKADASVASYHCEICVPRQVDYEIPMDEFTEHGHRYYMTLMRGDLQLRQGDTVYVLRDIPIPGTDKKHTYDTIGKIEYSELDIFRVERLWKDKDSGRRFAYGHHYLRPHETFHEPTRKFFPNEVMRVPLYEAVPVELVMEHCWVMDINTFCKGRPIGSQEQHVYICEYRVDKGAKMFSKTSKSKFPICTKSFAFEPFETRLKISRTYCPHDVDATLMKNYVGRKKDDKDKGTSKESSHLGMIHSQPNPPIQRTPAEQKTRLNKILLNLLSKMPTKQVLDVSYLLEGGRRRKKQDAK